MWPIVFPSWTPLNVVLYCMFSGTVVMMGLSEFLNLMPMRYSKFRTANGVDTRIAMFVLYFMPLLAALGSALPDFAHPSLVQVLVLAALGGHFIKRCLEVLFLHRYSGPMELFTTVNICIYYTLVAGVIAALNHEALPHPDLLFWLGALLFAGSETGNFIHHKILADLRLQRAGVQTSAYVLPRGGLFEYTVCPHYLFEILAWFGLALMSRHLFTWLTVLGMASYLALRSLKTLSWYQQKFPDFPRDRKALIPFAF